MKNSIFILLYVICSLFFSFCYAQWSSDIRLTNSTAGSNLPYNNAKCIAANGGVTHVVFYEFREGSYDIYYKRSTDDGISWGADTRLTTDPGISQHSTVTVSGSDVHIVWIDSRDANFEVYYKRSTDGGVSWGADTRLTNNTYESQYPSLSVSGLVVHVVWYDNRDGNSEIYYKRSSDGGVSWNADTRLTNNSAISGYSSVTVSGSTVHVVFQDQRDGNYEIYYKSSTDGGVSWGADARLTNNTSSSTYPSVSVSGLVVHVVWYDNREGNNEIYYKRSTDGGVSWGADTRLTNNTFDSLFPSVSASGLFVNIVWRDSRDGNSEIYYKLSSDGGTSWGADTRLTNNVFNSTNPFVSVSGTAVHVLWMDNRDGNFEIYYKREPSGNPIGIIDINTEIPNLFSLSQNFPNPFNPATNIKFSVPKFSFVNITVHDITGREIAVLVNEELSAGTYIADFDASKYASGIYLYTIRSGSYRETKKMLMVK